MAESKIELAFRVLDMHIALLRAKDPLQILAVFAHYGLQGRVSARGASDKPLIAKLQQHHVELLQAFALTIPMDQWGREPVTPKDILHAIDTVVDLGDAFHQRRLKAMEQERDLQARTVFAPQERLRMHTQIVRNWGYISPRLYRFRRSFTSLSMKHFTKHLALAQPISLP